MNQVYNPETQWITEIERLELETRNVRRRIEHAHTPQDKRVLNRQLDEIKHEISSLRARLP